MKTYDNEMGGKTVVLTAGDDVTAVPPSHRGLITDDMLAVLDDVPGYFSRMADRMPFPRMAEWLRALVGEGRWSLELHRAGFDDNVTQAGFNWSSERVRGAEIGLPANVELSSLSESLGDLYRLVSQVDWMGFGTTGRINSPLEVECPSCNIHPDAFEKAGFDPYEVFEWGGFNGDVLFGTPEDRAGWMGLASHEVHVIGSVAETIDWIFAQLMAGRNPDLETWHELRKQGSRD